ncbi:MAG: DNA repair protein RecN [Flavobacteriales bacterium]|nr:DNA repair protein RecN [Flavobacteriales bacterium]
MLTHLYISNYAIIEHLEIDFKNGFTVITGETGAGKSILLGALSLVLGQRADLSVLNDASKKCIVECFFQIDKNHLDSFFTENDIDFENNTTVRREILPNGKSRAFINDTPVNLALLKQFAESVIDIHSQHETLNILDQNAQLDVIDTFAGINSKVENFEKEVELFYIQKNKLQQLIQQEKQSKSDLDYIEFQVNELEALNLYKGEQIELEEQLELINNSEEIKQTLFTATERLKNSESNILSEIKTISKQLDKISHCSEKYLVLSKRISELLIELQDLSNEIELLNNELDVDSKSAEEINERLNTIYHLEKKHHVNTSDELLDILNQYKNQLNDVTSIEENITIQQQMVNELEKNLFTTAHEISLKRKQFIPNLEKTIISILKDLGMPESKLITHHSILNAFNTKGIDDVYFLFSANKGFEPKELNKVASGGELSRLMLAIKSILSRNKAINTILFDEIDTGVSGDIADKMGEIMKQISQTLQVIAITHLPQVAAKGNHHFKIFKNSNHNKTITSLKELDHQEKIEELAKMLSGKELTKAAIENAKNLITK